MYNAIDLAKYIVTRCANADNPISNLQLQKILYYVQMEFLNKNRQAFNDAIEAWQFGPVVPNVYYYFCGYGAMPITNTYDVEIDPADEAIINPIVDEKSKLNPWDMVAETHKANGAWDRIYKNGKGNKQVIPFGLIHEAG